MRVLALAAALAVLGLSACIGPRHAPLQDRGRVESYYGFSFQPPQEGEWFVEESQTRRAYYKKTDVEQASFFVGAEDRRMRGPVDTDGDLVAVAKWLRGGGPDDGRFADQSATFRLEAGAHRCVRYELKARDQKPKQVGNHPFLQLTSVGRICVHPASSRSLIDLYYSVRHAPTYDASALVAEGEAFLQTLEMR